MKYEIAWADSGDEMSWGDTVKSLILVVKAEIENGFQPQGGVGVIHNGDRVMLLQPMVSDDKTIVADS